MRLGVIGARGLVGEEFLKLLAPFQAIQKPTFISTKAQGQGRLIFRNRSWRVFGFKEILAKKIPFDLIVSLAETDWALKHLNRFAEQTSCIIDESAAFRNEPNVPLLVPEINGRLLAQKNLLIASPNCTTVNLVLALAPIHGISRLRRVIMASYQSASGAGREALLHFVDEARRTTWLNGRKTQNRAAAGAHPGFGRILAGNVIAQIGAFDAQGWTQEEKKVALETKKILNCPDLTVSAICVRVPVLRAHCLAVWVETEKPVAIETLKKRYRHFPGTQWQKEPPTPLTASGKEPVFVGRLRRDPAFNCGLSFWVCGDNLLKGAALNVFQIMQLVLKNFYSVGARCGRARGARPGHRGRAGAARPGGS